ncbi:DUF6220 domain-containing protein [Phytomonospora endophytica]|uniref:Asparagine N-glycosylation enzyme membrane subunit Stt3 n=1 Tax=Phytomonospora endophytica TaxID=714109 RepID=A0A841FFL6_9ACTN|nr:DUF6220 domain-containing protein [Phytomonospora endophytica]MBB6034385.1 asparagine N-glycosylation enzyme membrane subunit Stt3 [Phytomonospora endophytica]GIG66779.1 hypothetical protein Pen01_30740 [Phytomonospora endophytica]
MRKVFAGLSALLLLLVAAQFFFAAAGAFSAEAYRPHHVLGYVIFSVPVVMAIVGAVAKLPGRLIGMSVAISALVGLEVGIATIAKAVGELAGALVFGLHALAGMAIMGLAVAILQAVRPRPAVVETA